MAHWLEVPELEALVDAADRKPPSLDVLRECVEAIAEALEREVTFRGHPPVVTFLNHRGAYYNVSVREQEYWIIYEHSVTQLEFALDRTCALAWRICGYKCTPAEMREAKERARREGFTGEILPNEYFAGVKAPHV
jgi:hypothetical protein